MKLLILVLNREEYTEKVLETFVEQGVPGATVIDTIGMGRVLSQEIPIFAGFVDMMAGARPSNKTIFTLVEDESVDEIRKGVEAVIGSLEEPGTGILFTVPVDYHCGVVREWRESSHEV